MRRYRPAFWCCSYPRRRCRMRRGALHRDTPNSYDQERRRCSARELISPMNSAVAATTQRVSGNRSRRYRPMAYRSRSLVGHTRGIAAFGQDTDLLGQEPGVPLLLSLRHEINAKTTNRAGPCSQARGSGHFARVRAIFPCRGADKPDHAGNRRTRRHRTFAALELDTQVEGF